MLRPILASVFALSALAAPVSAVTQQERKDHTKIVEALDRANFSVYVNEERICGREKDRFLGAYLPGMRAVVICQEEKVVWDGEVIPFTEEDLDTLRHEAHHVVQDCLKGGLGDNSFANLFGEQAELEEFVRGALTPEEIDWVITSYSSQSNDVILNELEAFATAKVVTAETITQAVNEVCQFRF